MSWHSLVKKGISAKPHLSATERIDLNDHHICVSYASVNITIPNRSGLLGYNTFTTLFSRQHISILISQCEKKLSCINRSLHVANLVKLAPSFHPDSDIL